MKKLFVLIMILAPFAGIASNYPTDYCHAVVRVCKQGPGVVAQVSSGCNSSTYVIGYKKNGLLGNNSFVDAVVQFKLGDYSIVKKDLRITPDWHNLGFITSELKIWSIVGRSGNWPITAISIAFSDGKGAWDSNYGENYQFPIGSYESPSCYSVKTNENYTSTVPLVPFSAWNVINEAMAR